ncbi:hypothetical protein GNF80_16995 [Clostridium perfringens]|nr:hypothetical protein [Clostridium perfringens]
MFIKVLSLFNKISSFEKTIEVMSIGMIIVKAYDKTKIVQKVIVDDKISGIKVIIVFLLS